MASQLSIIKHWWNSVDPRWGRVIHQTLPSLSFLAPPILEGSGNQTITTLCACHGRLPSIDPIWRRQASHGWGKKWSGWNRTNRTGGYGPAVTDLQVTVMWWLYVIHMPAGSMAPYVLTYAICTVTQHCLLFGLRLWAKQANQNPDPHCTHVDARCLFFGVLWWRRDDLTLKLLREKRSNSRHLTRKGMQTGGVQRRNRRQKLCYRRWSQLTKR